MCLLPEILFHLFGCFSHFCAVPFTCTKQLVVCPKPVGRTFSPSSALIKVDLPLEVRPMNTTLTCCLPSTSLMFSTCPTSLSTFVKMSLLKLGKRESGQASKCCCVFCTTCVFKTCIFSVSLFCNKICLKGQRFDLTSERSLKMVYASFLASSVAASLTPPLIFKRPSLYVDQSDFDDLKTCFGFGSSFPSTQ